VRLRSATLVGAEGRVSPENGPRGLGRRTFRLFGQSCAIPDGAGRDRGPLAPAMTRPSHRRPGSV